jgi:hypothetical protein
MSTAILSDVDEQSRFWSQVDRSQGDEGCWPWTGGRNANGYGRLTFRGQNMSAHRAAYILELGSLPPGRYVLHRCDNRLCVNPRHLRLGSRSDLTDAIVESKRNRPNGHH